MTTARTASYRGVSQTDGGGHGDLDISPRAGSTVPRSAVSTCSLGWASRRSTMSRAMTWDRVAAVARRSGREGCGCSDRQVQAGAEVCLVTARAASAQPYEDLPGAELVAVGAAGVTRQA